MHVIDSTHSLLIRHNKQITLVVGLIAFTAAWFLAIYADVVNHEFLHWDDIVYIVDNPFLHQLSLDNLIWMFTDSSMMNWHPLTWLSHSLDFALFGKNPVAIKIVNILLHIANCVILLLLFRTLLSLIFPEDNSEQSTRNVFAATLAACIYAIHPQHIESVAWIAERKDILCSIFYFSTLQFYLKYHQHHNHSYLTAALVFATFSFMSKPMAVSLPLILILLDIFPLKLISGKNSFLENIQISLKYKITIIVLSIFISALTLFTQSTAIKDLDHINVVTRIVNSCVAILHYLSSIVFPANLLPFYPFSESALSPGFLSFIPIIGTILVITSCAYLWKKGSHLYLFAMWFFLITVVPVIGIIAVGNQAYADRYTYITTSMFYLAISYSISGIFHGSPILSNKRLAGIAITAILVCASAGMLSANQIKHWRNDETLWLSVNKQYPNKVHQSYHILGNAYLLQGRYKEAIDNYKIAIEIDPDSSKTYENLGRAYAKTGSSELEIKNYLLAIKYDKNTIWPRLFAGKYYLEINERSKAEKLIREALAIAPQLASVIIENAKLDLILNQPDTAKYRLTNYLKIKPDNIDVLWMLAQIFNAEGNKTQAIIYLDQVLKLNPTNPSALKLRDKIDNSAR